MVAAGGLAVALTSGRFDDFSPRFTADGRYLAFLSARTFDPQYDSQVFSLSFASPIRPYLAPVSATDELPFGPSVEGRSVEGRSVEGRSVDSSGPGAVRGGVSDGAADRAYPDLDTAGFEDRAAPLPVPSGNYRDLRAVENGVAWVRESSERGELGAARVVGEEKKPDTAEVFAFDTRSVTILADKADRFEVSGDGTRIVVRSKDEVSVVPVDATGECGSDDARRVSVDLSRLRYTLDRRAEWRQMYAETHRLMAQHYWREDMDGVDWDGIADRYAEVVARVSSHDELVDVLWEMVGELNSSHAYVTPPTPQRSPQALGHLGADFSRVADGWRIDRVLPGESSDPTARSPLRAAGVDARIGDVLVAIDDRPLDAFGPNALLQGAADKPVALTLRRHGDLRRVVVVPVPDDAPLRYQDWVRGRAEHVAARSEGRLGYVHVPDMVASGWAQLHRRIRAAMACEGVVVDVRHNRGGHTSQLVLARVMQQVVGWDLIRHQDPAPYPALGRRGPVAFVTNEQAGSDGDIVCAAARELGLGPVIGMRSWGGVIGIDGRFDLVDGTAVTQPRFSFWFPTEGWGVENHGVDPDIVVEHSPGDFGSTDRQLDAAVDEVLRRLAERPAAVPPSLPEPRVGRPRFDA
jgi:tricorn protease